MKPHVIMHMLSSVDGRLHASRWTASPDGGRDDWSALYERIHDRLDGDAWIVGRVTMAELSKTGPHAPADAAAVDRALHVAAGAAARYAVALDPSGRLHFDGGTLSGDPVIVLLGPDVADGHLAELRDDGVSYVVAQEAGIDLAALLDALAQTFGIRRLLLEGGAGINGSFLAAGLVDEISVLVAPALDGGTEVQGIVAHEAGLRGAVELRFLSAEAADGGVVHLRYAVSSRRRQ